MAERRMFAKTIIDSDAFLDMPLSSQALYFHLSMRGDDDGFINNPKKIQRMIGSSDDDLKLLIAKRFIIPFDSGIVVIKHWKIHNYIRNDRYKETVYQQEKAMLETKENSAYKKINNVGIPSDNQVGYQMETQVRLGEVRLGEVSVGNNNIEPASREKIPYDLIANAFNKLCPSLPSIKAMTDTRKKNVRARFVKEFNQSMDQVEDFFRTVEDNDFLTGRKTTFRSNFDWLMKQTNTIKVLEGNYNSVNRINSQQPSNPQMDMAQQAIEVIMNGG